MNRIDRLFNILLFLQSKKETTAATLAQQLSVSERTIYRDMAALMQMGVPLIAIPGEGYALMPGYYLPPLLFTKAEARALLLGANLLSATGNLQDAVSSAATKLQVILPDTMRETVDAQVAAVRFIDRENPVDLDSPTLQKIQRAIIEQQVIRIDYFSRQQEHTQRDIEPLQLILGENGWYIDGFCRLRNDFREFRVDRIQALRVLPDHFDREDTPTQPYTPSITIEAIFRADMVRWVRERQHYSLH